jgi:hypothetical protein
LIFQAFNDTSVAAASSATTGHRFVVRLDKRQLCDGMTVEKGFNNRTINQYVQANVCVSFKLRNRS